MRTIAIVKSTPGHVESTVVGFFFAWPRIRRIHSRKFRSCRIRQDTGEPHTCSIQELLDEPSDNALKLIQQTETKSHKLYVSSSNDIDKGERRLKLCTLVSWASA